MSLGQAVLEGIISGSLCHSFAPEAPDLPVLTVWSSGAAEQIESIIQHHEDQTTSMHYRNGREAKNGDKIVQISGYGFGAEIAAVGVLYGATPGNNHCNGMIAPIQSNQTSACLCDCLHVEDLAEILEEKGLGKRPDGM